MHIDMPVSLIAAVADPMATPQTMADWGRQLPKTRFQCPQGAAHMSVFAESGRVTSLMREMPMQ